MNIVTFFKENKLGDTIELKESKKKTYQKSDTPIVFIRLERLIPDTDQEVLVLSRGLAEAIAADELSIKDAEVTLNKEGVWGIIRPDTCRVIATVKLW